MTGERAFDPERTRYLFPIDVGDDTALTYASAGELALLRSQVDRALERYDAGVLLAEIRPDPAEPIIASTVLGRRLLTGVDPSPIDSEAVLETVTPLKEMHPE